MGNTEFEIPNHVKRQWIEPPQCQPRLFTNTITQETFEFINSPELQSDLYFAHLIERSIYPIPKTPKIIILNDNISNTAILVQKRVIPLKAMLAQVPLHLQLYKIIRDIAVAINSLFKRFGPFGVTEGMIGGTASSQLLVWVNQHFELCQVQYQLKEDSPHQHTMLLQLLQIVRESTSLGLSEEVFTSPPPAFDGFIEKIDELIKTERQRLMLQKISINSRNVTPPYPLSPRKRDDHSSAVIDKRANEYKKKGNIPAFFKSFKEKRQYSVHKTDIKVRENLNDTEKSKTNIPTYHKVNLLSSFENNNKIICMKASPCSKIQTKHHKNSSLTTNYSLLSFRQSYRMQSLQTQKLTEKNQYKACSANGYQQVRNYYMKQASSNNLPGGHTFYPVRHFTNQYENKPTQKEGFVRKHERTAYSYGSLNLHCKNLSKSVNLAQSIISEVESHYLGNIGISGEENLDTVQSELMAILGNDSKRENRDISKN